MSKRSLAVALTAIALGAVTTVSAHAEAAGNPVIEIKSVALGSCWEPGKTDRVDDIVVLAPCDGSAKQRWEKAPATAGGFVLRNTATGRCVTGWGYLSMWHCEVEGTDQAVQIVPDVAGAVKLKYGEKFADSWLAPGVGTRGKWDGPEQKWLVTEVGTATPPADTAGKVVRIKSHYRQECATPGQFWPVLAACDDSTGQRFGRIELGDGWFQLRSESTGTCVADAKWYPELAPCAAGDNQKWRLDNDSLGLSTIVSAIGNTLYVGPAPDKNVGLTEPMTQNRYAQKWEISAVA
ncbi:hypothetical protein Lesp02_19460 [Lentzea sp. NBRC 105346]|uniref:RICIN domain-containing protein n=1 Tax=Lentzea sp. NBRC 105346 TaxID=3032205 RepID=UPI0024A5A1C3|nr:hypothetical protein [Lentzea sp. NBRC 105346]GLZ29756.1 hypothetical protein Lesp02_19460 [Lentzea sp. NBRC 105346]